MGKEIKIEIIRRHVHLCDEHFMMLFGLRREMVKEKDLFSTNAILAKEKVAIKADNGTVIENMDIIGPACKETKVVVSLTDALYLNMNVPLRDMNHLENTPGIMLKGPYGEIRIKRDVIIARRHVHMSEEEARELKLKDGDMVSIKTTGDRAVIFQNVIVYVGKKYHLIAHIDADEGVAAGMLDEGKGELIV